MDFDVLSAIAITLTVIFAVITIAFFTVRGLFRFVFRTSRAAFAPLRPRRR